MRGWGCGVAQAVGCLPPCSRLVRRPGAAPAPRARDSTSKRRPLRLPQRSTRARRYLQCRGAAQSTAHAPPHLPLGAVLGVPVALVRLADAANVLLELARLLIPAREPGRGRASAVAPHPGRLPTMLWTPACPPSCQSTRGEGRPVQRLLDPPGPPRGPPCRPPHFSLSLSVFHVELAARKTYLRRERAGPGAGAAVGRSCEVFGLPFPRRCSADAARCCRPAQPARPGGAASAPIPRPSLHCTFLPRPPHLYSLVLTGSLQYASQVTVLSCRTSFQLWPAGDKREGGSPDGGSGRLGREGQRAVPSPVNHVSAGQGTGSVSQVPLGQT